MSLQNYLRAVDEAWNDYDGDALATYLSFQDHHVTNPKLQVENPESQVEQNLDNPIDEIGIIFFVSPTDLGSLIGNFDSGFHSSVEI